MSWTPFAAVGSGVSRSISTQKPHYPAVMPPAIQLRLKTTLCNIEVIPIQQVNEAYERVLKSDVRYRFVIDMASLKKG